MNNLVLVEAYTAKYPTPRVAVYNFSRWERSPFVMRRRCLVGSVAPPTKLSALRRWKHDAR